MAGGRSHQKQMVYSPLRRVKSAWFGEAVSLGRELICQSQVLAPDECKKEVPRKNMTAPQHDGEGLLQI